MASDHLVAGRFEIGHSIGAGGMGTVYAAIDRMTGERVALKILRGQSVRDRERFARESRVLAELRHPGVVRYIAHGSTKDDAPYLAMEWLEGEDLDHRLQREGLSNAETVKLIARVADTLSAAHARGIIHRDLKPSNLFLPGGDAERVKLLDFGIARSGHAITHATRTGSILGTPAYMSPEQARGDATLDARTDLFALGCVMFECLTGQPPFVGEHVLAVLAKILLEESPHAREVRAGIPEPLDNLAARMMAKSAAQRPESAAAVALELASITITDDMLDAPPASVATSSITTLEQRLISVVLIGAPDTLDDPSSLLALVRGALKDSGARTDRLADGSVIVLPATKGTALDQAMQAARSALIVRARVPHLPMALATGRAELSTRLPLGEVIDRAASLLTVLTGVVHDSTSVPVDEVTAGLIGARFDVVSEGGNLALAGERESGEAARLLLGKETVCVGRDREITVLTGAFEESESEPVARATLVTAPPGMGKSRLLQEFLRRLEQRPEPPEIWIGTGDVLSAGAPFGILARALRRAAGLRVGESLETRQRKLRARVARHVAEADVPRISEFLGELLGVTFPATERVQLTAAREDPMLMGDQMLRAWQDFLAAECAAQPVVLVLEDLHWGDLPTTKFVDAALRQLHDQPFFVLALARPEAQALFPNLWEERSVQRMPLGALTKKASERLVREAMGASVADDVVAAIVQRASGNAFFLEELVRAAADGRTEGLPETVLAIVQARLEGLDPKARRVLRAASLFGQTFWTAGVSALLGGADRIEDVQEWLKVLVEREVIAPRGESRFPGETEYTFRHGLLRDAAYATLTDHDRALGHWIAAGWLERAGEGEAAVLGEHFERAGRPERATACFLRAAEQALDGNDLEATLERAARAVGCGAQGRELGTARLLAAHAHEWRGEFADAALAAREAMLNIEGTEDAWFVAARHLGWANGKLGHLDELVAVHDEVRANVSDVQATGPQVAALTAIGIQLVNAGLLDIADALLAWLKEFSVTAAEASPVVAGRLGSLVGHRALVRGDLGSYCEAHKEAARSFELAGDARNVLDQQTGVGYSQLLLGEFEAATTMLRKALAEANRLGLRSLATGAKHNLGLALARLGHFEEARALEVACVDEFSEQGDVRLRGWSHFYLALIYAWQGHLEAAEKEARIEVEFASELPTSRVVALAGLAFVLAKQGRGAEALETAERAMAVLEGLGGIDEIECFTRLVHAEALHATGKQAEAAAAIARARDRLLECAEKIGDPATREGFLKNVPENARVLELARAWFER